MSENTVSSSARICHCGIVARQFTSKTLSNPERKFYKCPNRNNECGYWKWDDEEFSDAAVIAINQVRLELEAAKGKISVLNMSVTQLKMERDGMKEKLEAMEIMNDMEVRKVIKLEEKVLKMKMFIIVSCALIIGFVFATRMN